MVKRNYYGKYSEILITVKVVSIFSQLYYGPVVYYLVGLGWVERSVCVGGGRGGRGVFSFDLGDKNVYYSSPDPSATPHSPINV